MRSKRRMLDQYFDDELFSSTDEQLLVDWLKSDPANIKEFIFEAHLHQGVKNCLNSGEVPSNIIRHSFRIRLLAIAASVLVLLGAGTAVYNQLSQSSIATVDQEIGNVSVRSRFKISEVRPGMKLGVGTQVICKAGRNAAVISTHDGSAFTVSGSTRSTFNFIDGQYRVKLHVGVLTADVAKQPEDRPLLISTPSAEMIVRGTTLNLRSTANSTQLTVDEGRVEIRKKRGKQSVVVNAGETAFAAKGQDLVARRNIMADRFKGGGKSGHGEGNKKCLL